MIEKDNIKELFSRTLENHTAPVRPEVWNGLQAKMAAAGVSSVGAGAAAKGLSALTKWLIGSAAVAGTAVVTTIAVVNTAETPKKDSPVKTETIPFASQQNPEGIAAPADGTRTVTPAQQQREQQQGTGNFIPTIPAWDNAPLQELNPPLGIDKEAPGEQTPLNANPPAEQNPNPDKPVVIEDEPETVSNSEPVTDRKYEAAKIEFPNIFTPNGDGENDVYKLLVHDNIQSIDIVITDTENKVVYRSSDPAFEWDGTYNGNGEPVPDGLYACSVVYKDKGDNTKKKINLLEVKRRK